MSEPNAAVVVTYCQSSWFQLYCGPAVSLRLARGRQVSPVQMPPACDRSSSNHLHIEASRMTGLRLSLKKPAHQFQAPGPLTAGPPRSTRMLS